MLTRICLTSRFPMIIWWGPDLRMIYNDAYLPLMGGKHPALDKAGASVWPDIWPTVGPMLHSVLGTGQPTWSEDLLLPMGAACSCWEETCWTYSYSPLHDDDGGVSAVFTAVTETTERVIGARRLAVLQDLGAQAGAARTVKEACALVSESLSRAQSDVPCFALYLREDSTAGFSLAGVTRQAGAAAEAARWPLAEALRESRPLLVVDLAGRVGQFAPRGAGPEAPTEGMVLPMRMRPRSRSGRWPWRPARGHRLDSDYQTFMRPGRPADGGAGQRGHRLSGPAAAGRGTGRAGPGQDHVLLQHQP